MSLAFDEGLLRSMSDYIVAVNRLRHARERAATTGDAATLHDLAAGEQEAERACLTALVQRGWQPPHVALARGA
jgi:hypothetical protein